MLSPEEADQLAADALVAQDEEQASGYSALNRPLRRLSSELSESGAERLIAALCTGDLGARQLAPRILIETTLPSAFVIGQLRAIAESEQSGVVLRWVATALGYTRDSSALPLLRELSKHPDAAVRFPSVDALAMSSGDAPEAVEPDLLRLSTDADRDVRWSAIVELAALLEDGEAGEDAVARLRKAASDDTDEEIRVLAREAIER